MADFSGPLSRAPVIYVLCQVRFSAVLKMVDYLPEIQEALRERYPRFRHEVLNTLEVSAPGGAVSQRSDDRWTLHDFAEMSGFVVQSAAFTYHTTAYTAFDEFLREVLVGMQTVAQIAKLSLIERVGLRYVDFVVPNTKEELAQYLQPGLTGLSLRALGFQQETMQQFTSARTDAGRLYLKVSHGIHPQPVPGDLQPLSLKVRKAETDRFTAILDSDHFTEEAFGFELARLESVLRQLHGPISKIFRAAITDHAWSQWK